MNKGLHDDGIKKRKTVLADWINQRGNSAGGRTASAGSMCGAVVPLLSAPEGPLSSLGQTWSEGLLQNNEQKPVSVGRSARGVILPFEAGQLGLEEQLQWQGQRWCLFLGNQ